MDICVQMPGKAGLSTQGSTASLSTMISAAPSPANLQRQGTNNSAVSSLASPGGLQRQNTNRTGVGLSRGGSIASGIGSDAPSIATSGGGSGLLGVDLQQIVGAFSCETDRSPPNLDCGLAEWEHFYALHQQRVTAGSGGDVSSGFVAEGGFAAGSMTRTASVRHMPGMQSPGTPSSANTRSNYWTTANTDTGTNIWFLGFMWKIVHSLLLFMHALYLRSFVLVVSANPH